MTPNHRNDDEKVDEEQENPESVNSDSMPASEVPIQIGFGVGTPVREDPA